MKGFVLEMLGAAVFAAGLAFAERASSTEPPTSRVERWLVDPTGAVDGVQLSSGQAVYFAPETGRAAVASLHVRDAVRLDVEGGHRWLLDARDESRIELLPAPARGGGPRSALGRLSARGAIQTWLRGPDGLVNGFVLSTGEQVRVPASLMPRLLAATRIGDVVTVGGLGTQGAMGTGLAALEVADAQGRELLAR